MRTVILGLAGGLLLTAVSAVASASDFEGLMVLNETSDGITMQQQWFLKGDKLRFEEMGPDADKGAMIFDAKKKVMYSLQHDEKIYMEIPTGETSKAAPDRSEDVVVIEDWNTRPGRGVSVRDLSHERQVGRQHRRALYREGDRECGHARDDERASGRRFVAAGVDA
jgi:hypothetical protein